MIDILILNLKFMLDFIYYGKMLLALPRTVSGALQAPLLLWAVTWRLPFVIVGFIADVVMNNTTVPLVLKGGWFQEATFSQRLERLCVDDVNSVVTKDLCIQIALAINRVCKTKDHILAVLNTPTTSKG